MAKKNRIKIVMGFFEEFAVIIILVVCISILAVFALAQEPGGLGADPTTKDSPSNASPIEPSPSTISSGGGGGNNNTEISGGSNDSSGSSRGGSSSSRNSRSNTDENRDDVDSDVVGDTTESEEVLTPEQKNRNVILTSIIEILKKIKLVLEKEINFRQNI